jgi:hypothetical protein
VSSSAAILTKLRQDGGALLHQSVKPAWFNAVFNRFDSYGELA